MDQEITQDCIAVEELQQLLQQSPEQVLIIDVRTIEEFAVMHVPHAVNIPLKGLEIRSAEIPKDKIIITSCYKGGNRSEQGADILQQLGFRNVKKLCGGACGWFGIEPE